MKMEKMKKFLKRAAIVVPVICGIAVMAYMKSSKKPPVRIENKEKVQAVRVIRMEKTRVVPRVSSYGFVQPDRTWSAIPEVSGKIVYMNENLKKGHFIQKGDILFKIDTTAYGLAESRGEAELMNIDARLRELDQSRENTQRLLEIEKKSLASAKQELKRKQELFKNGYISASALEKEERTLLTHQNSVSNLQNKLDLIPSQKKALQAQKKSGESTVRQQRLDVEKTQIEAPFNCRISSVNIEMFQFAAAGSILAEAVSIDRVEIPVPLTPDNFFVLMPKNYNNTIGQTPDISALRKVLGITAKAVLPMDGGQVFEWEAQFSRTSEAMDTKTGALTAYVTVDNPYGMAIPGKRPPLVGNMYVRVLFFGREIEDRFVMPRSAVHDGRVYICTPENRLEIRPVEIEFYMTDVAVVKGGIQDGESLVLSDLVPAIEGMRLKPVIQPELENRLKSHVTGRTSEGPVL